MSDDHDDHQADDARKFKIGDKVIWTDIGDKMPRPGIVRAYVEPDGDYDLTANGPLYDVQFTPDQHYRYEVAEVDLAPSDGTITTPPPDDPFTPYDLERLTREAGGTITAAIYRGDKRLTIGAFQQPHWRPGNAVTIRMWLNGERTDAIDLDLNEALMIYNAIRKAAATCWPPDPPPGDDPGDDPGEPPCAFCGTVHD